MIFLGLLGHVEKAQLESALIAMRGEDDFDVLGRRTADAPPEIAQALAALRSGQAASLEQLGQLDRALGEWIGAQALILLDKVFIKPANIDLGGCQAFLLPGGLALGNLTSASQASDLIIAPVTPAEGVPSAEGMASAEMCAYAAWQLWRKTCLPAAAQPRLEPQPEPGEAAPQAQWITEARNPATLEIDRLPTLPMLRLINREDRRVPCAVGTQLVQIAQAVDEVTLRMQRGGRLIYAGAGTSGRIGVLDASEIPPTYGASPDRVVALIAGGDTAIRHSLEGVEDNRAAGAQAIAGLNVGPDDAVVGIAASGRTPYVLGALEEARQRGALTISIACNSPSPLEQLADIVIAPLVGPEVITGSTRMKAGTAQKLTLNMLSTAVMIRLGKTFGNLMVDVQTSNTKLYKRARSIVAQACGLSEEAAERHLSEAGGEVKTAIVAIKAGVSPDEARRRLAQSGGVVRAALETAAERGQ